MQQYVDGQKEEEKNVQRVENWKQMQPMKGHGVRSEKSKTRLGNTKEWKVERNKIGKGKE
jgi:hypothetical protein